MVGSVVVVVSMDMVPGAVMLGDVVLLSICVDIHSIRDCRAVVLVSTKSRDITSGAVASRTVLLESNCRGP